MPRRFEVKEINFWGLGTFSGPEVNLAFEESITLIDGEIVGGGSLSSNGAGKTTLLNAIMLGLLGELPSGAVRGDGIISMSLRDGTDPAFSSITMYDRVEEKMYFTEWRKVPGKGAEYVVSDDHNVIGKFSAGDRDHEEFLRSHFRLVPESFCEVNYYPQGSFSRLVDGTDLERKRSFIDVLGLSSCGEYAKESRVLETKVQSALVGCSSSIQSLEDRIRSLKGVRGDLKNIETGIAELESDLASIEFARHMVVSAIDSMSKNENLIRDIEHLKESIVFMEGNKIEAIKSLEERRSEYERQMETLDRKVSQIEPLESSINEKESEIKKLTKEIAGLESRDSGASGEEISSLVGKIAALESKIEDLVDVFYRLKKPGNKCYVCGGSLKLRDKRKMFIGIRVDVVMMRIEIASLNKRRETILEKMSNEEVRLEVLHKLQVKAEGLKSSLSSSKQLLGEFQRVVKEKEVLKNRFESVKIASALSIKRIEDDIEDCKKEITRTEKEIKEKFGDEGITKLENARSRLNELNGEKEVIGKNLATLQERADHISEKVSSLAEMKRELRVQGAKVSQLKKMESAFNFWYRGFSPSGIPTRVIEGAIPKVNESMSYLCKDLVPDKIVMFNSGRQLSDGRESDELILSVLSGSGEEIPFSLCSGGERKRIRMVVRLALAEVVSVPFNIFLFDEALMELDAIGKETVVKKITNAYGGDIILLSSNDDSVKDLFENRVTVVKENDISRVEV